MRRIGQKRSDKPISGIKGVLWNDARQQWRAKIVVNGLFYNLGGYEDRQEAINRRLDAEAAFGDEGEFVRHDQKLRIPPRDSSQENPRPTGGIAIAK